MQPTAHPEVLARDWLPPVVVGRAREVNELVRRLDAPRPNRPGPWIVAVSGAAGSGTSTVARRAGREVADRLRASLPGPPPRVIAVRTLFLRGTHGVVSAMIRQIHDGFDGRGFPVLELLAGFLRRVRREARPTVLVLDDVGLGGPDLAPIVRALGEPDRFLPEGESGLPPLYCILAGTSEGLMAVQRGLGDRVEIGPFIGIGAYGPEELRSMVADRAHRALGHPLSASQLDRIIGRALEDGGGAQRAVDLLRREILGLSVREMRSGEPSGHLRGIAVESWVVRAIGAASRGESARVGEVRRLEAELARAEGSRPLPTTTLWRRFVQLEQAGYVRREIRTGGSGGTRSILRVLTPIDAWVTSSRRPGTRPSDERWVGPDAAAARPALPSSADVARPPPPAPFAP